MPAFSCQNWPATSDARSVESTTVIFLSIAIAIVATPARALWQGMFEHAIDYFGGIANDWIVRVANPESHQMQEIAANNVSRRVQATAVGQLNHGCIRIGVRIRRVGVRRIDSDVMTRESLDQVALRSNHPFFEMRCQPVGVCENKIRTCGFAVFHRPLCCANESCNHCSKSGR